MFFVGSAKKIVNFLRSLKALTPTVGAIEKHAELVVQMAGARVALDISGSCPFKSGQWELIGGEGIGWPDDLFYKVRSLAIYQGALFASLTGPRPDGPCGEVWRYVDGNWACVGNNGDFKSVSSLGSIEHLHGSSLGLLTAHRSGVWCFVSDRWKPLSNGLRLDESCGPYCFADWRNGIAMGQWGRPEVAVMNEDNSWSYLPRPEGGWGHDVRTIYALKEWRGYLYAATGTGKFHGPGASVWRFDGVSWEQVGGAGIRGSWSRAGIPFVLSLGVFNDLLVATISRPHDTPSAISNVWAFDGDRWGALAVGATPSLMSESLIMNENIVYRRRLVVATGHGSRKPAAIWALDRGQVWRSVGPQLLNHPGVGVGGWWIYCLCTDGNYLYAGLAGHQGAAKVLRFNPSMAE